MSLRQQRCFLPLYRGANGLFQTQQELKGQTGGSLSEEGPFMSGFKGQGSATVCCCGTEERMSDIHVTSGKCLELLHAQGLRKNKSNVMN